jgi:hypothetical protein
LLRKAIYEAPCTQKIEKQIVDSKAVTEQMDRFIPQRMKLNLQSKFEAVTSNQSDASKLRMQENIPDN